MFGNLVYVGIWSCVPLELVLFGVVPISFLESSSLNCACWLDLWSRGTKTLGTRVVIDFPCVAMRLEPFPRGSVPLH